jgi:hypothetical protein
VKRFRGNAGGFAARDAGCAAAGRRDQAAQRVLAVSLIRAEMSDDDGDVLWEAFVTAMLAAGPVAERRSRYGDKPALFTASREIAHLEASGVIDLRLTQAGWWQVKEHFGADPAVRRDQRRRGWIEPHLSSAADLDRLGGLLAAALAASA